MGVDLQIALGVHGEVEATVPTELVEHVVVERDPGADVGPAGPVEVDGDGNARLLRLALASGSPHAGSGKAPLDAPVRQLPDAGR